MIIEFTHFCLNHVNVVMIFGSNDGRVGSANIWFHAGTSRRSDHPARPLYWRSCMKACSRTGTAGCYRAARTQGGAAVRLGPDGSTTTIASSADPAILGQAVTFTATVSANAPGSGTPAGTVTFRDKNT